MEWLHVQGMWDDERLGTHLELLHVFGLWEMSRCKSQLARQVVDEQMHGLRQGAG
jgi:hypothetical protein